MPARPLPRVDVELSGRSTTFEIARARLLDVDADRRKRIDDAIDYFGAARVVLTRDPCGESLLDATAEKGV